MDRVIEKPQEQSGNLRNILNPENFTLILSSVFLPKVKVVKIKNLYFSLCFLFIKYHIFLKILLLIIALLFCILWLYI